MRRPVRTVTWAYDRDSRAHPFIMIGVEALRKAGYGVEVIDGGHRANPSEGLVSPYDRQPLTDRWNAHKEWLNGPPKRWEIFCSDKLTVIRAEKKQRAKLGVRRFQPGLYRLRLMELFWSASRLIAGLVRKTSKVIAAIRRNRLGIVGTYCKGAFRVARARGDVIVASRPHILLPCWLTAKLRGRRLVYYPFELYGHQTAPYTRVIGAWEKAILRIGGVDMLITQNERRAGVYRGYGYSGPVTLAPNRKPAETPSGEGVLRAKLPITPDTRIVLYEGALIPGRWLDRVAQAALLLPEDAVMVFMGRGTNWWKVHSPGFLKEAKAASRLFELDPVPHDEVLAHVADAYVGLITYDDSALNNIYCAPGKLSDYVMAGAPIVAPAFPTLEPEILGLGVGRCFEDPSPEGIAAALREVLATPRSAWTAALKEARYAVSWESVEPAFLEAVAGAPSSRRQNRAVQNCAAAEASS